ncbi:hypothetical protein WA158_002178 [Blastocystis sp. Blastoise]
MSKSSRYDSNKQVQGILKQAPHKQLPVGTAGPVGASFAVIEKNWICPICKTENFSTRNYCFRCRTKKPDEGGGLVMSEALLKDQAGEGSAWREAIDPKTTLLYYFNTITGQTQWQRPAEMGAAPTGTGWYGRGAAGNELVFAYEKQNVQFLQRPARKQAETIEAQHTQRLEGANEYNIWYHRWQGDAWDFGLEKGEPAATRCNVADDAGYTKADKESVKGKQCYFCIHFARGCCAKGSKCDYYHRIPIPSDMAKIDLSHDCFGRERFGKHRDDMGGIGSFESDCRTLYVAGLDTKNGTNLQEIITRHFSEFGEVEQVNVIYRLSIAFVRFRMRCSAEFAKVAMANQALDEEEVLNIRWAFDDPNPIAKEAIERANRDAYIVGMQSRGVSLTEAGFQYPNTYHPDLVGGVSSAEGDTTRGYNVETGLPNTEMQFELAKQQGYTVKDETRDTNNEYMPYIVPVIYPENVYEQATDALDQMEIIHENGENNGIYNESNGYPTPEDMTLQKEEEEEKQKKAELNRQKLSSILDSIGSKTENEQSKEIERDEMKE